MKLICDKLAENGYDVIMPDCFRGETKATNPDVFAWLKKYTGGEIMKDINACIEHLLKTTDISINKGSSSEGEIIQQQLSFGTIGFCWGGWAIAKSASEGIDWKCAISAHPSTKIETLVFGDDETSMFEKVRFPFLLLPAGDDMDNLKPGSQVVAELNKYGGKSVLFERMNHGWVTRGDLSSSEVKEDAEKALTLALDFFHQHL